MEASCGKIVSKSISSEAGMIPTKILVVFHKKYFRKRVRHRRSGTLFWENPTFPTEKRRISSVPAVSVTPFLQPVDGLENRGNSSAPDGRGAGEKAVKPVDKPKFSTLSTGLSTGVFLAEKCGEFLGG
jgi:hypothetical protein